MEQLSFQQHVGRRLRSRRQAIGKSQVALGAECGVSCQQIQKYETGATAISVARLWALARALQVPISYFFDGLPPWQGRAAEPSMEPLAARAFKGLTPAKRDVLLGLVGALGRARAKSRAA